MAAAFWLTPRCDRLRLFWQSLVDAYYNNERVGQYLEALLRQIPHRLIVVWDRGNMHKGDPIRAQVERFRPRLSLEILPSYAPMLNPVEQLFSWLKYGTLSNYAPHDAIQLNQRIAQELGAIQDDDSFLRLLWSNSKVRMPKVRIN